MQILCNKPIIWYLQNQCSNWIIMGTFNIHYLYFLTRLIPKICKEIRNYNHSIHMPDYSSWSLIRYLTYNDATVKVLALFSTLHHCQFWTIHNEMYINGLNVLRVFWCTDNGHWSKWSQTHLHPPLTANVLPDVATIHIFSPWSSPCCRGHKNWCSSGTWVTQCTWINVSFHKDILWNNYYWYQNHQTSMQSTLPTYISNWPISGFLGNCDGRKILKWLLRKSDLRGGKIV
jgi:hypothetical protein